MARPHINSEPGITDFSDFSLVRLSEIPEVVLQSALAKFLPIGTDSTGRRWNSDGCPTPEQVTR